jgi:hypothetical protein
MKFYKFWAPGEATVQGTNRPWKIRAYGGSDTGMEEALRKAQDAAQRVAAAIQRGDSTDAYGYSERPMREEIVQEIQDVAGLAAVITRNSYGALVLNTSRVMFVDVDIQRPPALATAFRSLWNSLRGKATPASTAGDAELVERFDAVGRSQPNLGFRVYRTAGGFRLLVTSDTYDPLSEDSTRLMGAFGSDPLYMRLCKAQECFRARLSAKFWRCGARRPPPRFPWATTEEEQHYRHWEEDYHRLANRFASCAFIGSFGRPGVNEGVQQILEIHDRLTMQDGAPLA